LEEKIDGWIHKSWHPYSKKEWEFHCVQINHDDWHDDIKTWHIRNFVEPQKCGDLLMHTSNSLHWLNREMFFTKGAKLRYTFQFLNGTIHEKNPTAQFYELEEQFYSTKKKCHHYKQRDQAPFFSGPAYFGC
jgi:hypothetical protein